MSIFIMNSVALYFILLSFCKICNGLDTTQNAFSTALTQLSMRENYCSLIIDSTEQIDATLFQSKSMPLFLITPENLRKKHFGFSLCDNIVVLLDTPGHWLNWLPVDHNIIFISNDAKWIGDYPRLTRLQNAFFFIPNNEDNESNLGIYERKLFEDSFRKVPLQKVNELMEEHLSFKHDYEGVNFRAVAFNFPPFSVLSPSGNDGYEFNIVSAIAQALKMDLEVRTPTSGGMWGWQEPNGNYTGLQGDLQHDVAEIGWGNLFMTTSRMEIMDFTDWYLVDPTCFVYKRPSPYAGVFSLVFPLRFKTWFFIAIILVAVNLFYLLYSIVWRDGSLSFGTLFLYETSVAFKVSHEMTYKLPTITLRFFTAIFLLVMMVITAAYSGALISFFSVARYPSPPQTFDDIAKVVQEDDLMVQICCQHIETAMQDSDMESFKIMTEPERLVEYVEGHMRDALIATYHGEVVYVYSKNALEILRRKTTDAVPYDQVGIMRDCFLPNRIGFGMSQNSPFKASIDRKLDQLKQAGIVGKIIGDGHELLGRVQESQVQDVRVENEELEFVRMQGIFQVWLVMVAAAAMVFVGEMVKGFCLTPKMTTIMPPAKTAEEDRKELIN